MGNLMGKIIPTLKDPKKMILLTLIPISLCNWMQPKVNRLTDEERQKLRNKGKCFGSKSTEYADCPKNLRKRRKGKNNQKGQKAHTRPRDHLFIKVIKTSGFNSMVMVLQKQQATLIKEWEEEHNLWVDKDGHYSKGITLVVPQEDKLQRDPVELIHDSPTAGHPGIDKTHEVLLRQYWWLECKEFVSM
jgi:hypothetical protein